MQVEQQIALVGRLRNPVSAERWGYASRTTTNPASHYVDRGWFEDEREAVFRSHPQFVGLSSECRSPGDYLTRDCGGIPILVLRQTDGSLKAFVNACMHRAAPLLKGDGSHGRKPISCPYHAWTYELSGRLRARPHSDGGFDDLAEACDLRQRAVIETSGLIFVHPSSIVTIDAADLLHGVDRDFASYGIEAAYPFDRKETIWPINWKLLVDTFLEPYHVRFVHRDTIDPTFLSHQLFDTYGSLARVIGLRRSVMDQLDGTPASEWRLFPHAAAQYVLLPNALLSYQGDHIETWRFEPLDLFSTRVVTSIFAPAEPRSEKEKRYWQRNFDILLKVAFEEDFPIQQQIQDNLRSGAVNHVHYGRLEPALGHFHSSINAMVAAWRKKRERMGAMSETEPDILYEIADGCAWITLNRPAKRNALSEPLMELLSQRLWEADEDNRVRCVVLRAAGPDFSSGYDLQRYDQPIPGRVDNRRGRAKFDDDAWHQERAQRMRMALFDMHKPVIAQVHGRCLAGGTDLALLCDMVVCAEDALFGFPPARSQGSLPSHMWLYLVGPQWAKRLLLTGDSIRGDDAVKIGLALKAVPAARLDEEVTALAQRLALIDADLLSANKRIVNVGLELMGMRTLQRMAAEMDARGHLAASRNEFNETVRTDGLKEAVRRRDEPFGDSVVKL